MSDTTDDLDEFGLGGAERIEGKVSDATTKGYVDGIDVLGEEVVLDQAVRGWTPALQQALQKRFNARSPFVKKVSPTKTRTWAVGFGPVTIPRNSTQAVSQRVSCLYRPKKIVAYGDTNDVSIESIFIGQKTQMAPGASLPLTMLTSGADYPMDIAQPAIDITISLRNRSRKTKKVGLTLFGEAVV